MNHQDVRNQYLQVHGIDPVEIEVDDTFRQPPIQVIDLFDALKRSLERAQSDDEPTCPAARHGRRHSNCTCEDSRDE